ncbi:MAG: hypothetical protein U0572_05520 [Phycisphaerales bacterium]
MRIDARDTDGRWLGRIEVDPGQRPSLVAVTDSTATTHERFLNWDGALDDAGHLRHCLICGCPSMYRSKALPQVTPFIVVLAFAGAFVGLLGYATNPIVLPALVVLLVIDIATLVVARTRLVCYRCGSRYSRLSIARYHRRWDRNAAAHARAPTELATPSGS